MTRWFFGAGSETYREFPGIKDVFAQLGRLNSLFEDELSYRTAPALPALSAHTVRQELGGGPARGFGADDTVVVYYSGHGYRCGERHYLVCEDTLEAAPAATALATDDLVRLLAERGARRLLLVIDTCEAAAGAARAMSTAAQMVLGELAQRPESYEHQKLLSFSVLCASRAHEVARGSEFSQALEAAVRDEACGGTRAPKLLLETLVDHVNARLGDRQHATHATFLSEGAEHPFFPNPRYWKDAPQEGVSLAEQEAARRAHDEGRATGRGGSTFVGRTAELDMLETWVTDADPAGRWLAVVGAPGSGKSALLGEFHRRLEERYTLLVDVRRRDLDHLTARIEERGRTGEPLVLLVDGVEEAGPPEGGGEPLEIAQHLNELAATRPWMRVVATASKDLAREAEAGAEVDLDQQDAEDGTTGLTALAARLLVEPHGPGSRSDWSPEQADTAAPRIVRMARGHHLLLRLIALRMAAEPPDGDTGEPPRDDEPLTEAVARALKRLIQARCRDAGDAHHVYVLLTGLAFTRGAGLPWAGGLWPSLASDALGLSTRPTDEDVRRVLDIAAPLVAEGLDPAGRSAYRLHHESYAEVLRKAAPERTAEHMARALRDRWDERTERHPDRPADPCLKEQLGIRGRAPEPDLLPTVIDEAGDAVQEVYAWYAERYPGWWRLFPELYVIAATRRSKTTGTTDRQGQEIFTMTVPADGELHTLKISRGRPTRADRGGMS